jgi:MFS family permease
MLARTANAFRLALFWLGIQAVWGALLGVSLQARATELSGGSALIATGRLATIGAVVAAITQVVVGIWSDGRRRAGSRRIGFYIAGAIGGSAALLFFYEASTMFALTIAFIAVQASLNLAIGPYQAIIPDFVESKRTGVASSWMAALQGAGNAIGALGASFIVNLRLLGASLGALLLSTCAVTVAHIVRLPLRDDSIPTAKRVRVTRAFADLFISRAFVYSGFYTLLFYLFFYVSAVFQTAALSDARRDTGILIVAFTLVGMLGAGLAARPSDRLDKRLVANVGGGAFMIALGLFIGSHSLPGAAVATLVAGMGWGVFLVADWAIACRILPPNAMAAAMGVWNLAVVLPQIVAPLITTIVLQRFALTGGPLAPRVAFGLALVETFVGIAWLWRIPARTIAD